MVFAFAWFVSLGRVDVLGSCWSVHAAPASSVCVLSRYGALSPTAKVNLCAQKDNRWKFGFAATAEK